MTIDNLFVKCSKQDVFPATAKYVQDFPDFDNIVNFNDVQ